MRHVHLEAVKFTCVTAFEKHTANKPPSPLLWFLLRPLLPSLRQPAPSAPAWRPAAQVTPFRLPRPASPLGLWPSHRHCPCRSAQ